MEASPGIEHYEKYKFSKGRRKSVKKEISTAAHHQVEAMECSGASSDDEDVSEMPEIKENAISAHQRELKLITLIAQEASLYNNKHPFYRNNVEKEREWLRIANTMAWSAVQCKSKWKALRDQYCRELKRCKFNSNAVVKWKHFKSMEFLRPFALSRNYRPRQKLPSPGINQSSSGIVTNDTSCSMGEDAVAEQQSIAAEPRTTSPRPSQGPNDTPPKLITITSASRMMTSSPALFRDYNKTKNSWPHIAETASGPGVLEAAEKSQVQSNIFADSLQQQQKQSKEQQKQRDPSLYGQYMQIMRDCSQSVEDGPISPETLPKSVENQRAGSPNTVDVADTATNYVNSDCYQEKELIALIRAQSILYDPKCVNYRNLKKKHEAWNAVAAKLGTMTVKQCRLKWKALRDQFIREHKRLRGHQNIDLMPRWKHYDQLNFLIPFFRTKTESDPKPPLTKATWNVSSMECDHHRDTSDTNSNNAEAPAKQPQSEQPPEQQETATHQEPKDTLQQLPKLTLFPKFYDLPKEQQQMLLQPQPTKQERLTPPLDNAAESPASELAMQQCAAATSATVSHGGRLSFGGCAQSVGEISRQDFAEHLHLSGYDIRIGDAHDNATDASAVMMNGQQQFKEEDKSQGAEHFVRSGESTSKTVTDEAAMMPVLSSGSVILDEVNGDFIIVAESNDETQPQDVSLDDETPHQSDDENDEAAVGAHDTSIEAEMEPNDMDPNVEADMNTIIESANVEDTDVVEPQQQFTLYAANVAESRLNDVTVPSDPNGRLMQIDVNDLDFDYSPVNAMHYGNGDEARQHGEENDQKVELTFKSILNEISADAADASINDPESVNANSNGSHYAHNCQSSFERLMGDCATTSLMSPPQMDPQHQHPHQHHHHQHLKHHYVDQLGQSCEMLMPSAAASTSQSADMGAPHISNGILAKRPACAHDEDDEFSVFGRVLAMKLRSSKMSRSQFIDLQIEMLQMIKKHIADDP